jgi:hypothetical protein
MLVGPWETVHTLTEYVWWRRNSVTCKREMHNWKLQISHTCHFRKTRCLFLRTPSVLIRFHTTNVLWAVSAGDILFYSYTQRYRRGPQKEVEWSMQKYLSFLKIHCSNSLLNKFGIMHYVFHVHDKSPPKRLSTLCKFSWGWQGCILIVYAIYDSNRGNIW